MGCITMPRAAMLVKPGSPPGSVGGHGAIALNGMLSILADLEAGTAKYLCQCPPYIRTQLEAELHAAIADSKTGYHAYAVTILGLCSPANPGDQPSAAECYWAATLLDTSHHVHAATAKALAALMGACA